MNKPAVLGGKPRFTTPVKLVDITFVNKEQILKQIDETLDSSLLTNNGKHLIAFEEALSRLLGVPVVAVANATLGLTLLFKAAGLHGKIIMPSFTFCATAHSAVWAGLEPVFVDIDEKTFTLDVNSVKKLITPDVCAIVGVHTFGNPCAIEELEKLAKSKGIRLFFDAAHAFGVTYHDKPIGSFGDAEVFSTHATKTLITGEGGFVSSNDKKIIDNIKRGRNFGFNNDNSDALFCGTNAKMTEIGAIIGLDSLDAVDGMIKHRGVIAAVFRKRLSKIPGLRMQEIRKDAVSSYCFFGMLVILEEFGLDRDGLAQALAAENVVTRKYFSPPLHRMTAYKNHATSHLPVTEFVSSNIICLPIHSKVTVEIAEEICTAIENIHKHAAAIHDAL